MRLTLGVCGVGVALLACNELSSDGGLGQSKEPLLADYGHCGPGRLESFESACRIAAAPVATYPIAAPLGTPFELVPRVNQRITNAVRLTPGAAGLVVANLYNFGLHGEWAFHLSVPSMPFKIRCGGIEQTPVCSRYLGDELATELLSGTDLSTCRLRAAYVVSVPPGNNDRCEIELGPTSVDAVNLVFTPQRPAPVPLTQQGLTACDDAQLSPLSASCAASPNTTAINAGAYGDAVAPQITAAGAYGVHLREIGDAHEGVVELNVPVTDDYLITLGTPYVPVGVTAQGREPALPICASVLSAQRKTALTGGACDLLRASTVLHLSAGNPMRIALGPTGLSWVRLAVSSTNVDSDGDAAADPFDACPTDPRGSIDEDGDGICTGVDNCPGVPNVDQRDSDANGVGDACESLTMRSLVMFGSHTCGVLSNGTAKCWGNNASGQLGLGDTMSRPAPAPSVAAAYPTVDVGVGNEIAAIGGARETTCALTESGKVKCWGAGGTTAAHGNGSQQTLGDEPGELGDALPYLDLGTGRTARELTHGGGSHVCARLDNGSIKCWGLNVDRLSGGALGTGNRSANIGDAPGEMGDALRPVNLGTGRTALAVAAGFRHTCALLDDHSVKCWGDNSRGQLGLGDTRSRGTAKTDLGDLLPSVNLGTGRTALAVDAGYAHTCALLDDHSVKCWGGLPAHENGLFIGDEPGELGDALAPVPLGSQRSALAVVTGSASTCALLDNHNVKCWGENYNAQLGIETTSPRGYPTDPLGDTLPAVQLGTGRSALAVLVSAQGACAVLDGATFKCWGDNSSSWLSWSSNSLIGATPGSMGDANPTMVLF